VIVYLEVTGVSELNDLPAENQSSEQEFTTYSNNVEIKYPGPEKILSVKDVGG
jgi:hypothetical protein